jgi:hypothetical protein
MQSACPVYRINLWLVPLYSIFPHHLINGMVFGKELFNIKCVFHFSLQPLSETFLMLRRTERGIAQSNIGRNVKYLLFLSEFNEVLNFPHIFSKNTQI